MFHNFRKVTLLFFIILIAWLFRFNNLNWDRGFHLHPDERFLTMVSTAMKLPASLNEYFSQKISLLNPSNIGYKFFVYGNFPLVINKYLAVFLKMDNYDLITILGRQLSVFFDLLIVILVFKTTILLTGRHPDRSGGIFFRKISHYVRNDSVALWASFIYAISVLPIQLSHFFAVDSFLNFFMFGSFYFALRYSIIGEKTSPLRDLILSAIFFGLALSCKVTAIFILPLILILQVRTYFKRSDLIKYVLSVVLFFLVAYFTLRLTNPYYFQNQSFFDLRLSTEFVNNLQSLRLMTVKNIDNWYPPMVQWLSKNTVWHSLVNNIVFGMGIPMTAFLIIGIGWAISNIKNQISKIPALPAGRQIKNQKYELLIILLWFFGFFVYQSLQVTPTLRYFIILYPFFSIFSGIGIVVILSEAKNLAKRIMGIIIVIAFLIWPLMFSSIYFHKNTRVEASEWIYKNLPANSVILGEYWDDPLPLSIVNNRSKQFTVKQLPVFDPDTREKWQKMNEMLNEADYYILSSNRGWGSVTTVPKKYPLMSKFYNELLDNKNPSYKLVKEITSYPSIKFHPAFGGIKFQINDDWSDEGFTVYDHPKVLIFKNVKKS